MSGDVYEVRRVSDPKTMGMRDVLVQTGWADASNGDATDEPREQQGPTLAPGEEGVLTAESAPTKSKRKATRRRAGKKNRST